MNKERWWSVSYAHINELSQHQLDASLRPRHLVGPGLHVAQVYVDELEVHTG